MVPTGTKGLAGLKVHNIHRSCDRVDGLDGKAVNVHKHLRSFTDERIRMVYEVSARSTYSQFARDRLYALGDRHTRWFR